MDDASGHTTIGQVAATTPHHIRSYSDTRLHFQSQLSPSPKFKEPAPKAPRDDNVIISTPSRMPGRLHRESLVLQMPARSDSMTSAPGGIASGRNTPMHSPQVERENNFESPTSMLPRHSRGLDFSRACSSLHHSSLPGQSTPDSSPKLSHRALKIPSRRQSTVSSMVLDSPRTSAGGGFGGDKSAFRPRSIGSTTAMTSEASSSDSDSDDEMKSRYDPDEMLSTPVMHKQLNSMGGVTPYGSREDTVTGGALHNPSPVSRRYTPYRRATKSGSRLVTLRSQHLNGAEENSSGSSTDTNEMSVDNSLSRRESISAVTSSLQLSTHSNSNSQDSDTETSPAPFKFQSPQVVRRPVTRRSNLLPKTKGFARIRAQLQEESTPVDTDMRRDAEVVRQVRIGSDSQSFIPNLSQRSTYNSTTASSSPDLTPTTIPHHPIDSIDLNDTDGLGVTLPTTEGPSYIGTTTSDARFNHLFTTQGFSTPPRDKNGNRKRSSSSAMSDDNTISRPPSTQQRTRSESEPERDAIPPPMFAPPNLPSAAEVSRKAHGKRRRDDDFDPNSIKRRAVSPGMSVHSSPVMGQSPVSSTGGGWWASGKGKESRENSGGSTITNRGSGDNAVEVAGREGRSGSIGSVNGAGAMAPPSTPSLGARRVGLQQGMSDTSEGLVKMSLE